MEIDPEEFRRHYASLSDEGLLAIEREDLVDAARTCYDEECAERGLAENSSNDLQEPRAPSASGELVVASVFLDFEEANLARGLLQSMGIACGLENEYAGGLSGPGSLRLMVHNEDYERACDLLANEISDEELAAQAEAETHPDQPEEGDQPDAKT